jgi:hypothetical protein
MHKNTPIKTREDLQKYLQVAIQLEHATIPPYLVALYSIKADAEKTNFDGLNIIRTVVVEEMLHLTLAANLLNAVGGSPDLLVPGFVPKYPTPLPTGQDDFKVPLQKYSPAAIDTFLKIERPAAPPKECDCDLMVDGIALVKSNRVSLARAHGEGILPTFKTTDEKGNEIELHFHTIGAFYKAIEVGIEDLTKELGETNLFKPDDGRQIGPEYFYSGGGDLLKVTDLQSALAAIELIAGQGEGYAEEIFDRGGELAHFYRFEQIIKKQYYEPTKDKPGVPSGAKLEVHWDKVYPIIENPSIDKYPEGSELREAALDFNRNYKQFLGLINQALNGDPPKMQDAVREMFKIRAYAERLIHTPLPSGEGNAAPTFEIV